MRKLTKVLLLAGSVVIISSVAMMAASVLGIPVDKIVRVDVSFVAFEGTVYKIYNSEGFVFVFEKIDERFLVQRKVTGVEPNPVDPVECHSRLALASTER